MAHLDGSTGLKQCSHCSQLKTADQYHRSSTAIDGLQRRCKQCMAMYMHARYLQKSEQLKEYDRQYSQQNRERLSKRRHEWSLQHREQDRANWKVYHNRHRGVRVRKSREYYELHREAQRDKARLYSRAHPKTSEYMRVKNHRRRSRRQSAPNDGTVTLQSVRELLATWTGICPRCGQLADPTVDHIIPLAKGGAESTSNFQLLCMPCNSGKGVRIE